MKRSLIVGLTLVAALIAPSAAEAIPVNPTPRPHSGIITDPICIFNHNDPGCALTTSSPLMSRHYQGQRGRYWWSGANRWWAIDPGFSVKIPDRSHDRWLVITPPNPGQEPYFFVSPTYGDTIFSS